MKIFLFFRGIKQRIKLVEAFFREVLSKNAESPREPPMDYRRMKGLVKTLLYAQGLAAIPVPDHAHYMNTQGGAYRRGFDIHVEKLPGPPQAAMRGRGGGRERRGRGSGAPPGPAQPTILHDEKVGRFPRNYKLAITAAGIKICMAYQQKRCVRSRDPTGKACQLGKSTMAHVCACILSISPQGVLGLCEGFHCWEDCSKKK